MKLMSRLWNNKWGRITLLFFLIFILFLLIPVSNPLFKSSYCTILEAKEGELLSAKIASDGQWRFPEGAAIPEKFEKCILHFEDEYFYMHPGINPVSMIRAAKQNWEADKIISGGSTLTMQVVRLARNGKRTIWQKLIEIFWAFRIEISHSKTEILKLYAAHAPFGGNVVGLEAASWRYYNRPPDQLSWAESATLAVLPNAPALIYPGRNQDALLNKRNRLLKKLALRGIIDEFSLELAMEEPLPNKPHYLPQDAIHLLNRNLSEGGRGKRIRTTIDKKLQQRLNLLVHRNYLQLKQNEIHNLAALIIDNRQNKVLAYVGNTNGKGADHGHRVDIITSKRSTGSLLKPFLYGLAWQNGLILQHSLLADVPTQYAGYAPKNFNKKFDGAVSASQALIRSLNVPAVRLLRNYGVERFYDELNLFPMPSINKGASHYGLSLILGGAEASLWEMCSAYKGMSQSLYMLQEREYQYSAADYNYPSWSQREFESKEFKNLANKPNLSGAAIWQLMESLKDVNRPGQEEGWESFVGRRKVAWKTGTSFGLRDAWAIGVCPEYTVGVWVGNADGEGRPGLTGLKEASPILFETFNLLGKSSWYTPAYDELYQLETCAESGYLKGINCPSSDTLLVPEAGKEVETCSYHQNIQLNMDGNRRVNSSCYAVADMLQKSYLVLPPLMEWFYRKKDPSYEILPPWNKNCVREESNPMELISPEQADQILIPIELGGDRGSLVVKVAHRNPNAKIYWHLNENYIGKSQGVHSKEITPNPGMHTLSLVDSEGNSLVKEFEIVD